MTTYIMFALAAVAVALAFGVNPAFLLLFALCPLMMFIMMRSMGDTAMHKTDEPENSSQQARRDRSVGPRT